jgi:predicted dehydrogenase
MSDRVTAVYALSVTGKAAPDLVDTDLETALLETGRGAVIRLTSGFTVAHPMSLYYHVVGTRGSATLLNAGGTTGKWWTEVGARPRGWQDFAPGFEARPDGRSDLVAMVEDFVASVRDDTAPPIDVDESMDMILPGILAHESGRRGGVRMPVPDPREW